MAQMYFRYSTMNAGKSIEVLKIVHNYEEQGKKALLLLPRSADRSKTGKVTSRIGIEKDAILYDKDTDLFSLIMSQTVIDKAFCVIMEEAQENTLEQVQQLTQVVDILNIPVIAYGLKNDFRNHLFPGSEAFLRYADKIEEIKTVCSCKDCGKKATMILRYVNGKPTMDGPQTLIGDNKENNEVYYKSVCRKHYNHLLSNI